MGETVRGLVVTWLVLMALTLVSMVGGLLDGDPHSVQALPLLSVAVILAATVLKARGILRVYLGLQASGPGWRGFFAFLVLAICGLILAGHGAILMIGRG